VAALSWRRRRGRRRRGRRRRGRRLGCCGRRGPDSPQTSFCAADSTAPSSSSSSSTRWRRWACAAGRDRAQRGEVHRSRGGGYDVYQAARPATTGRAGARIPAPARQLRPTGKGMACRKPGGMYGANQESSKLAMQRGDSAVPDGSIAGWVVGAVVGLLCGNALVVEEDLRPVGPRQRHRIREIRRHLFGVGPAILRTQRVEIVRTIHGGLLNLGRLVVLVDHVPLVVDRAEVARRGKELLSATNRSGCSGLSACGTAERRR
jgi:hypothetical protein